VTTIPLPLNKVIAVGFVQKGNTIVNNSASTIWIDVSSAVSSGTGTPLGGGTSVSWNGDNSTLFAILDSTATATGSVSVSTSVSDYSPSAQAIGSAIVSAGLAAQIATDIYNQGVVVTDKPLALDLNNSTDNFAIGTNFGTAPYITQVDLTPYSSYAMNLVNAGDTHDIPYLLQWYSGALIVHEEVIVLPTLSHCPPQTGTNNGITFSGPTYGDGLSIYPLGPTDGVSAIHARIVFSYRPSDKTTYASSNSAGTLQANPGRGLLWTTGASIVTSGPHTDWSFCADGYITGLIYSTPAGTQLTLTDYVGNNLYAMTLANGPNIISPFIVPRGPMKVALSGQTSSTTYIGSLSRLVLP
jgi:hypothetical protein